MLQEWCVGLIRERLLGGTRWSYPCCGWWSHSSFTPWTPSQSQVNTTVTTNIETNINKTAGLGQRRGWGFSTTAIGKVRENFLITVNFPRILEPERLSRFWSFCYAKLLKLDRKLSALLPRNLSFTMPNTKPICLLPTHSSVQCHAWLNSYFKFCSR